jgi:hypothetical protein
MNEKEPERGREPSKLARKIWRAINVIMALLTLVVLAGAMMIPSLMSQGSQPVSTAWQAGGMLALLVGLVAVTRKNNFSILFFVFACAFFFVSCTANFRWQGW